MSFEDIFKGVSFENAKIDVSGQGTAPAGQPAASPPATGQKVDSPPTANTTSNEPEIKPAGSEKKVEDPSKLPYDQDPKWKKARAAEAKLDSLMQALGVVDVADIEAMAAKHKDILGKLGKQDLEEVLKSAEFGRKTKAEQARLEVEKARTEGSSDDYIAKLEAENKTLRDEMEADREERASKEHDAAVLRDYSRTAETLMDVLNEDAPLSDSEKVVLRLFLGIDNPVNTMDLNDRPLVQKEVRNGVTKFTQFIKAVKDQAVKDYIAGKQPVIPSGAAGQDAGSKDVSPVKTPLPKEATFEQVMSSAKDELTELLIQSTRGL